LNLFIGNCDLSNNKNAEAEQSFIRADSDNADRFTRLYARLGRGRCAIRKRNYENAVQWFSQVQEMSHELQASVFEERALGSLGYVYFELGKLDRARESSQAAAQLAGEVHQLPDQEKWLLDLGRAYDATGQSALAVDRYKKSLKLARELRDNAIAARCLHNLTGIALARGEIEQAENYHAESEALPLQGEDLRTSKLDEAGIAAAKHEWEHAEAVLLDVLPQMAEDPLLTWTVEASLAHDYASQGKSRVADEWYQRSITTMQNAAAKMERAYKIATLNNFPIFDDYIGFLESQGESERALQVAEIARARALSDELGLTPKKEDAKRWVARIQKLLYARKAVILAYYEAEHDAYEWVITPKVIQLRKLGTSQNDLENLADTYGQEVQQQSPMDSALAQKQLFQLLIKPMQQFLPKGTHVILVPDSDLYRINFESLISDDGAPHYWIEDAELETASSIDLLLASQHRHQDGKGLLLIGAPNQVTPEFPTLPHANEEMSSVQVNFPKAAVTSYSGSAANPEAYLASTPSRFKFIEFATHGTASVSDPMDSAIVLSRGKKGEFRLLARDIAATEPKLKADLVTISACYGAGKFITSSEGLLGLEWAFMRAGAHQVVAGLWDVADESTPTLMGGLYSGIVRGESTSAALRAAKLKLMHSRGHVAPYYWAALQLYTGS
jgi:CHAT domain-containing protein/Flp pilus assembly protein TadD